jgi:hypothetical protein
MAGKADGAILMLGLGKKKPGSSDEEGGDEEMDSTAKEDAASAVLDAIAAKDKAGLVDALTTMYDLCKSGSGKSYSEGEEEGE